MIDFVRKLFYKKNTFDDMQSLNQKTFTGEQSYTRKKRENPFNIGDRVICRSNQDDPLLIGTISYFEDFDNPKNDDFPVVKCEKCGKEYICMSIVKPYSDELLQELNKMSYKEQWNYLAKNYKRV